jgi:hypothetical protein
MEFAQLPQDESFPGPAFGPQTASRMIRDNVLEVLGSDRLVSRNAAELVCLDIGKTDTR